MVTVRKLVAGIARVIGVGIIFYSSAVFALEQKDKLWTSLVIQKPFASNNKWLYQFYTSMRFVDESHPWQTVLLQGGLGYYLTPANTLWFGYRWAGQNPYNNFYMMNMLWQQHVLETRDGSQHKILLRSRLEEFQRSHQSQIAFTLRERFFLEMPNEYWGMINPIFYDEVFFQLNKTDYTSHQLVSQNRFFIGFNLLRSKHEYWEIGYINQYLFTTPLRSNNEMNHVISVTYIII